MARWKTSVRFMPVLTNVIGNSIHRCIIWRRRHVNRHQPKSYSYCTYKKNPPFLAFANSKIEAKAITTSSTFPTDVNTSNHWCKYISEGKHSFLFKKKFVIEILTRKKAKCFFDQNFFHFRKICKNVILNIVFFSLDKILNFPMIWFYFQSIWSDRRLRDGTWTRIWIV